MEENYTIKEIDPLLLFGANNQRIKQIIKLFPKLKIVARGNNLKINGNEEEVIRFTNKLDLFVAHILRYGALTENQLERLMEEDAQEIVQNTSGGEIILHGVGGKAIKAQTSNQRKMVSAMKKNDLLFAVGPAGTGKTYTAVALAVEALKNKKVKRIILTRPAVEAGENLGFLPGDLKEKLDPYMQPLYDALRDMIPAEKLKDFLESGVIEVAPLAFMRGRTLDKAYCIMDEAQNATEGQFRMFLTRMGKSAKFIVTGDVTQIDLPKKQTSGLTHCIHLLKGIQGIEFVQLDGKDVIRHKLVKKIIEAYDKNEQ
ncbi:MAG: phosphate starvation-inducible protein PhoH [Flavobacteriales bacterium]|nr:phosphate starvation-inducible protein PhoH [Flavobacteriales bacterium]